MDKIVGNKFFIFLSFVGAFAHNHAHDDVAVRITDSSGVALKEAHARHPFLIAVTIKGNQGFGQQPVIDGLDQFQINGRQTRMQMVNGVGRIEYIYYVTAHKQGTYLVGPVQAQLKDKKVSLPALRLVVKEEQPAKPVLDTKTAQAAVCFARLSVDAARVVVGQKVVCLLQVFSRDPDIEFKEIKKPDFSAFNIAHVVEPTSTITFIDGVKYTCLEWQWHLYPTAPGKITIPASGIDFLLPVDYGIFFLHPQYAQKRVYSNAVSLEVAPLPAYQGTVHAIGNFTAFSATIKPAIAHVGEGMVLTLEVEGSGDLTKIEVPHLDIGQEFSCYESKNYCVAGAKEGISRKCFEYIVQGLKAGAWSIGKQQFTYFDLVTNRYVTLSTLPVSVTIKPQIVAHSRRAMPPHGNLQEGGQLGAPDETDIRPLHLETVWSDQASMALPWWALFALLFISFFWFFVYEFFGLLLRKGRMDKKKIVARARARIEQAQRMHQSSQVYTILVDLLSDRSGIEVSKISQETLEHYLRSCGHSQEYCVRWSLFFCQVSEAAFSGKPSGKVADDLFAQAYRWLDYFEKKL